MYCFPGSVVAGGAMPLTPGMPGGIGGKPPPGGIGVGGGGGGGQALSAASPA